MAQKLAIFDFDDTLIRGQSFDEFIRFIYERESNVLRKILYKLSKILIRFTSFSSKTNKYILTRFMAGTPIGVLQYRAEEFANFYLEKKIIDSVYEYLQYHIQVGDTVVIVSGGLDLYIRIFAKKHNIQYSVATQIIDSHDQFKSIGIECLGHEKIVQLSKILDLEMFDKENSHVYSDHVSDLPLLEYFGKPHYVVHYTALIPDIIMKKKWDIIRYE